MASSSAGFAWRAYIEAHNVYGLTRDYPERSLVRVALGFEMSSSDITTETIEALDATGEAVVYSPEQHSIKKAQIDEDARKIVYRLQRAGFKAYIVGGGVRDILLGKEPKDFDISTDATPRQIKALFRNCRIIGRRFKLAHIYFAHGKALEVSTFRDLVDAPEPSADGEQSPAGPVENDNIYGTESTDAFRRDITINGLFLDVSTMEIIDYVGGMHDLSAGIIRVIGEPDVRFKEDPVRMLRVVRHSARNGFRIEESCWDSILRNAEIITQSSQVRVFDELKKDLTSGCFLTILSLLGDTGLLEFILPELLENNSRLLGAESDFSLCLEKIDDIVASGGEISPTVVLTIIALFTAGDSIWLRDLAESLPGSGELGEHLSSCFTRLTVPRKERERIQLLLSLWSKVRNIQVRALKPGNFKRTALLPELISLLEVCSMSREDVQKLNVLRPLLHEPEEEYHEHSEERNHSRRGRRR
jgi:poly(A) polymerase